MSEIDKRIAYYRINDLTLYLEDARKLDASTRIEERDATYESIHTLKQIMDHNCLMNGSSFAGRKAAMQAIFDLKQTPPIAINPEKEYYAFYVQLPNEFKAIWILTKQIKNIQQLDHTTIIHFHHGKSYALNISRARSNRIFAHMYRLQTYFTKHKHPIG
ncbi:ComK protein [Pelagirhabdus alkalitolerans]|uniref:ComK protein n=1 Tax=Pelagirhabdus alkalitolerans TaxID=1612202 RepID=A0A1G6GFX3_9BACI|nr:competence protein ComK [Pelagirhabdus alkalitolerans]SDB80887.1 ComK protein [Pelagirhabdus alkalitolerans]